MQINIKKYILPNLPYVMIGLYATKLGQMWRLAPGADFSDKVLGLAEGQELGTIPGITPNPAELGPGCEFAGRCPFCQERCKEKDIPRFEVSPGHYVRCLKFDSFQEVD